MNYRVFPLLAVFVSEISAAETSVDIQLVPGWNSIWLDVEPLTAEGELEDVENVFTNSEISFVATPDQPTGSAEFIADTNEVAFNQDGWKSWWRSSEIEEDSLAVVPGFQPYLVKVEGAAPITLSITGDAQFRQNQLKPKSYLLQGYHLDGSPTFSDFFSAAGSSIPVNKIFRLNSSGQWLGVQGSDTMQSHESYWIYAETVTDFVGPVAVSFNNFQGINFGSSDIDVELPDPDGGVGTVFVNLEELVLSNVSDSSQSVSLRKVGGAGALDDLRVFLVEPQPDVKSYSLGNQVNDESVALAAEETDIVTLGALRQWNAGEAGRENLYQIVAGGQVMWLPVRAENPDLSDAENGSVEPGAQGLWVGNVTIKEVNRGNSTTMDPSTSSADFRYLFHVDSSGAVSLLSHVMLMQEKRASETVAPVSVLLVDESKIPYYEGIEERAGKRVGVRFESIGYDMPRVTTLASQADLLDNVVNASDTDALVVVGDVTDADLQNFINSRTSRPTELVEDYHLSWSFSGGFGPNEIVSASSPLILDPFHRSNPFRHAFHPSHAAGYAIERDIEISFHANQADGVLNGDYTETVSGLTSYDIISKGTIRLERVSQVGELQ